MHANKTFKGRSRLARLMALMLAIAVGGVVTLGSAGFVVPVEPAQAAAPSTYLASAFKVEPDLTGAALLQGTTSTGAVGSNGYYTLKCETDLTTSTAPSGSTAPVAPEIEGNTLQYTVWTQNVVPTQSQPDATFFSDATKSGQQMRVQSISCVDYRASENYGYSYIIHAAPFNATSQQDNVVIRANAAEVRQHLALLYLNNANTISVPIAINTPNDVATTVSGVSYNSVTKKALFGKNADGDYVTQLTVTVPRDYHIEVVNSAGTVVSTVSVDNSTTQNTIQTLDVTASQSDRTTGLTVKAVKTTSATLYMPRYDAPQDSYKNYGRVRKLAISNDNTNWADYLHTCELYPWNTFSNQLWQVKTSTNENPDNYSNCGGFDYDFWGQNNRTKTPWSQGFPQSPADSWTSAKTANDTMNNSANTRSYNSSGTAVSLPTTVQYGGTVQWTVDNVPERMWDAADDPLRNRADMPNAFLANVRVNDEDLFVPFPQPWIDPSNPSDNTGLNWGRQGNGQWNNSNWPSKRYYSCARGWMLGVASGTNIDTRCGMVPTDSSPSFTVNTLRRQLTSYTFTTGTNAGMTVSVYLKNVRYAGDRLSLSNYRVAKEESDTGDGSNKVGENDAVDTSLRAMNQWRSRYEIVISGIKTSELKVETSFESNTHNRVFLANGTGVLASSDATRTSLQIHGHLNYESSAQNRWINICDGGSATAQNSGTGASTTPNDCSYMWEELTSGNPMQIRAMSPNGYGKATLTSPQDSRLVNAGVYDETDDYVHYDATKATGRTYTASGFTQYANTIYPLLGSATALDFPVKYMAVDGTTLLSSTDSWPAVFNVNAATRYSFDVANRVPDTGNFAFNSWKLEGWKGGTKVGTVLTGIDPGSSVDIRSLKFLDGSLSGKNALTDGGGNPRIDELRLVPDTTTVATGKRAGIYPLKRTIAGGGPSGADVNDTVWYYRAVPGMHTELASSYRTQSSVTTITYPTDGSTSAREFNLNADQSVFGPISLTSSVNDPALLLYYGLTGAKVKFTKTVENTTSFTWQQPNANNFALRLTKVGDTNTYYTIKNGQTSTAALPEGTYTLSEVQGDNSSDDILRTWKPKTSQVASGYTCTFEGSSEEQVNQQTKQLTITANSAVLNCAVTNQAAVIGLVTYNAETGQYVDAPSTGARFTYNLVPVNDSDYALTSNGWHEKSQPSTSSGFLTPGVPYKLVTETKPVAMYTKIQKYTGTLADFETYKNDPAHWEEVSLDNFTLDPNQYNIYRVVVSRFQPSLPHAGGFGRDQIILAGTAVVFLGLIGAAAHRRRRTAL